VAVQSSRKQAPDLATHQQTEGESAKLVEMASPTEAKKAPGLRMNGDVEVRILQIDGNRPVPKANGLANILQCFHAKMRSVQMSFVQAFEV
jgi:hypothetical protein